MAPAAGAAAYFQRGSLFWFTVITLSFGYYTVRAAAGGLRSGEGASARFTPGPRPTGEEPGEVVQAQSLLPRARNARLRNETQAYRGLSSGLRVSLIRALGPWAPSLSTWWTTITPSCTMVIGLPG
ncbi:transmembrane protein 254 isoform X2 [Macaca mulatta]